MSLFFFSDILSFQLPTSNYDDLINEGREPKMLLEDKTKGKWRKLLIIVIGFTHIFSYPQINSFSSRHACHSLKQWILISGYYITFVEFKIREMCFQGCLNLIDISG